MYEKDISNRFGIPRIVAYQRSKVEYLDYIAELVPGDVENVGDVFAGTGVIALMMKKMGKAVYANDYLFASWVMCKGMLEHEGFSDLVDEIYDLNFGGYVEYDHWFVSYYGDLYFSRENCARIAGIREEIERRYPGFGVRKCALLVGVLMGVDRCHCTRGQWYSVDVRRKERRKYRSRFMVFVPPWSDVGVGFGYNLDYREFCLDYDLLVVDPPDSVSLRNYRAAYHMLDTVCKWDWPSVKWRIRVRSEIDMKFDSPHVRGMVSYVLGNSRSRYVLLSLNDIGMVQPMVARELFDEYGWEIVRQKVYLKSGRVGVRAYSNAPDILEVGKPGRFMERIYLLEKKF